MHYFFGQNIRQGTPAQCSLVSRVQEIFACESGGLPIPFGEYSKKSAIEHLFAECGSSGYGRDSIAFNPINTQLELDKFMAGEFDFDWHDLYRHADYCTMLNLLRAFRIIIQSLSKQFKFTLVRVDFTTYPKEADNPYSVLYLQGLLYNPVNLGFDGDTVE